MPSKRECANAIRALSVDAIEKAGSGHPGAPLGMADMAEAVWRRQLKHNPEDPAWLDRDRFVLSNGHASMLLYSLLHLSGYDLSMEQIKNFRQLGSATPGHPEKGTTAGVEMSTGPLGQGIASAVGMALAEAMLAAKFNRPGFEVMNHHTWTFLGEGCLMEGISHEACALAGTWGLGKLICLFDANGISIDGKVDPWYNENVEQRFAAYGWQVLGPIDGHDADALDDALDKAREEKSKPSLIICKTHIGFGSPKKDSASSHGSPLGREGAEETKRSLGWQLPPFTISEDLYKAWNATPKGRQMQEAWNKMFADYRAKYPDLAEEFERRMAGRLPADWKNIEKEILEWAQAQTKDLATRVASRECLEILVRALPEMIGGAADLTNSVGARVEASQPLDCKTYNGNYIFYGVREFGMGAIINGLALHGGFLPYAGTFLSFTDQAKNAIRLAAMMKLHIVWIMTHDSIGVGEDGPTHQPVEQIPSLRAMPGMHVWRPCDALETAAAWLAAVRDDLPTCLVLSRQGLPQIAGNCKNAGKTADGDTAAIVEEISRGGYILRDSAGKPDIILLATGSEVALALEAAKLLQNAGKNCRVVSMPCPEIFDAQDAAWKEKVLPGKVRCRLAIEAARGDFWRKYVGLDGEVIGMENYGVSAPAKDLFERYGFTPEAVAKKALELCEKNAAAK